MKKIGVFFDAPGYHEYPFDIEEYVVAYDELATEFARQGGQFFIVRGQDTFLGNNRFSRGWRFGNAEFEAVEEPITLDVIYDKGHFVSDGASAVLNDRELDDLCVDKWKTCQRFPEYSPHTELVHDEKELRAALKKFPEDRIVFKPKDGEEGKGVIIGSAADILAAESQFPALVQEFIDTSGGIPGIADGLHDLRLHSICGEMVLAFVRTPAEGKLVANVSQGGTETEVPADKVPADVMKIFRDIDSRLSHYPKRVFCVDLGRGHDGVWKLIELNSKPGLSADWRGGGYRLFKQKLVDVFLA